MNFSFAARLLPNLSHSFDNCMIDPMGLYAFSATASPNSFAAFFASFALPTKCEITAIKAEIPATIHPNTGIVLMAMPTVRNAPARVKLATVPAFAATVSAAIAPAFAVCAVDAAPDAPAFAPFEAVFNAVAAVLFAIAAFSMFSAAAALATAFAHHSFTPRNVTRVNAESLFKASDTCCKPMVIAMTDCTLVITFCKSSFSPANNAIAPVAADRPPATPERPEMMPWNCAWSLARMRSCCMTAD